MTIQIRCAVMIGCSILAQACYGAQPGEPITSILTNTATKGSRQYFVSEANRGDSFLVGYDLSLNGGAVEFYLPQVRSEKRYPVRWCLNYDHIWTIEFSHESNFQGTFVNAVLHRYPWVYFVNSNILRIDKHEEMEIREFVISDPNYRTSMDILPILNAQRNHNEKIMNDRGGRISREHNPVPASFAFAPTSEDTVLIFLLYQKKMRLWNYSFKNGTNDARYWNSIDEGTVPVVFEEPFQVFSKDNINYFFITESGNIFTWKYGSKDAPGKIWDADKAPVKTIIQDADSDKVYAFAGGQYFELSEKIKPKEYSRSLAQMIGMSPSKNQLIEMARIIRADQSATKKK